MKQESKKRIGFSRKIFLAVFLSCLGILSLSVLSTSKILSNWIQEEYQNRYSALASMIGENIREIEAGAEQTMLNAALLVKSLDKKGVLSTKELKSLARQTNITHFFIIDKKGNFIRSTNEDPSLIPNLFSFCPKYPGLLNRKDHIETTPIIHPTPEPNPYKFLIIPNSDGSRYISTGLRVDFLATSLRRFQEQDPNIESIEIYSPSGGLLGSFQSDSINLLGQGLEQVPKENYKLTESNESFLYTHWTASNRRVCCQCETAGESRDGYYDYLIQTKVSKASLIKAQTRLYYLLALFALFSVFISWVLAKLISIHLVDRLTRLNRQVTDNLNQVAGIQPLDESGSDELSDLSKSFNDLLEQREEFRKEHIELERLKKKQELADVAAQVSHDIQSPILTLVKVGNEASDKLSDDQRDLLQSAASKLTKMTNNLLKKYRGEEIEECHRPVEIISSLERVLREKKAEYSHIEKIRFEFDYEDELKGIEVPLSELELARIISNLINNSIQACENISQARIKIKVSTTDNKSFINLSVSDNGPGISGNLLEKIRHFGGSFLKKNGTGLGLSHARKTLEPLGGTVGIYSEVTGGARVNLRIPIYKSHPKAPHSNLIVLIDDDPITRKLWELQASEMGLQLWTGSSEKEIPFESISKSTDIYVDANLPNNQSGMDICKRLRNKGYKNLYLTTSDPRVEAPSFVTLVGKEFPLSKSA